MARIESGLSSTKLAAHFAAAAATSSFAPAQAHGPTSNIAINSKLPRTLVSLKDRASIIVSFSLRRPPSRTAQADSCLGWLLLSERHPNYNWTNLRNRSRRFLRLIRSLHGRLPPRSGMGADRISEAFKENLAHVFEQESFADAQLGNGVRYQDLFRLRVGAKA